MSMKQIGRDELPLHWRSCFAALPIAVLLIAAFWAMYMQLDIRDPVRKKLITTFEGTEDLVRVLYCLDRQNPASKDAESSWRSLHALLNHDAAFKNYDQRLADNLKTAEGETQFQKVVQDTYHNLMVYSDDQHFDLSRLEPNKITQIFGFAGLAQAWNIIPKETQRNILPLLRMLNNRHIEFAVDKYVSAVSTFGGEVVSQVLAYVYLTSEA